MELKNAKFCQILLPEWLSSTLNADLTGSEIHREESSYILMLVKARFTDKEAREINPATPRGRGGGASSSQFSSHVAGYHCQSFVDVSVRSKIVHAFDGLWNENMQSVFKNQN